MDKEENKDNTSALETENDDQSSEKVVEDQKVSNDGVEKEKEEKEEKLTPEKELEVLKDKLARTFAEMENQRRRFEKEKDDAFNYGGFNFAKESLNLLDNLERSRASLENDEKLKNTEILKKTIDHLNIIYNDMVSIYNKNGIEEIKSIDQKLDPNLHQAMLEIEDNNKEPGTVVQEIQKGFMMKDRLLRPSLVAVSKKSIENEQKDEKLKKSQENQPKNDEK